MTNDRTKDSTYKANISIRSKGKFCVKVPKRFLNTGKYSVGEAVEVRLSKEKLKEEVVVGCEVSGNERKNTGERAGN